MKVPSDEETSPWQQWTVAISFAVITTSLATCLWWRKRKTQTLSIDAEAQFEQKGKRSRKESKQKKNKTHADSKTTNRDNSEQKKEEKTDGKRRTFRKMDAPADDPEPEDAIPFTITEHARRMSRRASETIRKMSYAIPTNFQFERFQYPEGNDDPENPAEVSTGNPSSIRTVSAKPVVVDDTMSAIYGLDVGTLYFTLSYNESEEMLTLKIQKAIKLEAMDMTGTSDPYVKVCLHPDKHQKMKTRIVKRNLNPIWNELFTFEGFKRDVLMKRTVFLQVYDYDVFSSDDHIGDVDVPLDKANLTIQPTQYIRRLRPNKQLVAERKFRGEILVSLCYDQRVSQLSVTIMKCRNLKPKDFSTGECNPYVKLIVLYKGRRIHKQKTETKSKEVNPAWNKTFELELPINMARDYMLVFRVMASDQILKNRPIGEASVGYRASGTARRQWTDMLCQPKLPFTVWHTLRRIEDYEK